LVDVEKYVHYMNIIYSLPSQNCLKYMYWFIIIYSV